MENPPSVFALGHKILTESIITYARDSFLIEYHGEGGNGNDPACHDIIDNNLAECSLNWGCKCQDSRNNTYNCLRTLSTFNANAAADSGLKPEKKCNLGKPDI